MSTIANPTAPRRRRFPAQVGIHLDTDGHDALMTAAEDLGLPPAALARVLVLEGLRARQSRAENGDRVGLVQAA
ncbi:MAG TPA: hypothetical protein VIO59_03545 [Rhodanobacter sp.]